RRVRQCRHTHGDLRRQGRHLRLWQLSRHRRAVRPAGGGNRSRQTHGDPAAHAAVGARAHGLCPDLAARLPQRPGSASRRTSLQSDPRASVFRALRRRSPQGRRIAGGTTMVSPSLSTARRGVLGLSAAAMIDATLGGANAAPAGSELRIGAHISLAPTWFDPAETPGIITPFMLLYAMHDAVMKAMPGDP